jgi:hypothetical protein
VIKERRVADTSPQFVRAESKPHLFRRDGRWALFYHGTPCGSYKTVREAQSAIKFYLYPGVSYVQDARS